MRFLTNVRTNASSPIGSLDGHRPIPGQYFLNSYSLSPVIAHHGLVLKRWVKEADRGPLSTVISPKGEYS